MGLGFRGSSNWRLAHGSMNPVFRSEEPGWPNPAEGLIACSIPPPRSLAAAVLSLPVLATSPVAIHLPGSMPARLIHLTGADASRNVQIIGRSPVPLVPVTRP